MRICKAEKSAARLVVLTAMVLVLGFAGIEDGVVLCFGGDGHVAIEFVGPEGCAGGAETAAYSESAVAIHVPSSHCGPCVDVALTAFPTAEATSAAKRTGAPASVIFSASPKPPTPHLRATIPAKHKTRFISEKPYTVVILC